MVTHILQRRHILKTPGFQHFHEVANTTDAERKITERSAVQEKLWKILELKKIEKQLSLHK